MKKAKTVTIAVPALGVGKGRNDGAFRIFFITSGEEIEVIFKIFEIVTIFIL